MRPIKSQDSLNHTINLVKDLLEKQAIVENLAQLHKSENVDLVESLVQKQNIAELERKF